MADRPLLFSRIMRGTAFSPAALKSMEGVHRNQVLGDAPTEATTSHAPTLNRNPLRVLYLIRFRCNSGFHFASIAHSTPSSFIKVRALSPLSQSSSRHALHTAPFSTACCMTRQKAVGSLRLSSP